MAKPKGTISFSAAPSASSEAETPVAGESVAAEEATETAEEATETAEEATENAEGDEAANTAEPEGTVSSAADPTGARYVAPVPNRLARLRATQVRLYNSYQKIYFNTETPSAPVEVDSWNQCQIDAGLLVEVTDEVTE